MKTILIVILFNSLTVYTLTARAAEYTVKDALTVICTEQDGSKLTVAEVEDAVEAYIEDVPNTDYSTEYDLLIDELCID